MRFIDLMKQDTMTLVVSCPVNDYEYVKAAWEAGADAVKIHLNVHHHASDTDFKSLKEEYDFVQRVLKDSPVPVGVVIGGNPTVVREDFPNILKESFDFLSLYAHDATYDIINQDRITRMLACNYEYSDFEIKGFETVGVEILEVSVIHPNMYGTLLTVRDIMKYHHINDLVKIPTLLPSQKKILTSDLKALSEAGFSGIMIGAVVTGKELNQYKETILEFRTAIDRL